MYALCTAICLAVFGPLLLTNAQFSNECRPLAGSWTIQPPRGKDGLPTMLALMRIGFFGKQLETHPFLDEIEARQERINQQLALQQTSCQKYERDTHRVVDDLVDLINKYIEPVIGHLEPNFRFHWIPDSAEASRGTAPVDVGVAEEAEEEVEEPVDEMQLENSLASPQFAPVVIYQNSGDESKASNKAAHRHGDQWKAARYGLSFAQPLLSGAEDFDSDENNYEVSGGARTLNGAESEADDEQQIGGAMPSVPLKPLPGCMMCGPGSTSAGKQYQPHNNWRALAGSHRYPLKRRFFGISGGVSGGMSVAASGGVGAAGEASGYGGLADSMGPMGAGIGGGGAVGAGGGMAASAAIGGSAGFGIGGGFGGGFGGGAGGYGGGGGGAAGGYGGAAGGYGGAAGGYGGGGGGYGGAAGGAGGFGIGGGAAGGFGAGGGAAGGYGGGGNGYGGGGGRPMMRTSMNYDEGMRRSMPAQRRRPSINDVSAERYGNVRVSPRQMYAPQGGAPQAQAYGGAAGGAAYGPAAGSGYGAAAGGAVYAAAPAQAYAPAPAQGYAAASAPAYPSGYAASASGGGGVMAAAGGAAQGYGGVAAQGYGSSMAFAG